MKKKLLTLSLYLLPILFFSICYYLMVVSGEDIFQGANTPPDLLGDALAAFHHSARLSDMFAWSIINFYTYTVSFGPDLICRTFDILAACFVFYLATYLVLRRRPRLILSDALTFSSLFLLVMLSTHGRIFYSGFSGIHNYVFLSLTFLLFLVPISHLLWNKSKNKSIQSELATGGRAGSSFGKQASTILLFFALSFLFAFSSNVTSIVYLISLVLYYLIKNFVFKQKIRPNHLIFASILGNLLALFLIYIVGDGLSDYSADPTYLQTYDYLSFSALFSNLPAGILKILKHNLWNTLRLFATPVLFTLPILAYAKFNHYRFPKCSKTLLIQNARAERAGINPDESSLRFSKSSKNFLLAGTIFVFTFILCFSQLAFPTRLALPAYLVIIILEVYLLRKFLLFNKKLPNNSAEHNKNHLSTSLAIAEILLLLAILSIRLAFTLDYRARVLPLLNQIRTSDSSELCFSPSATASKDLPYLHLGQESFLQDWALPETIYGKQVSYCSTP